MSNKTNSFNDFLQKNLLRTKITNKNQKGICERKKEKQKFSLLCSKNLLAFINVNAENKQNKKSYRFLHFKEASVLSERYFKSTETINGIDGQFYAKNSVGHEASGQP